MLEARDICKRFGGTQALSEAALCVGRGEIVGAARCGDGALGKQRQTESYGQNSQNQHT